MKLISNKVAIQDYTTLLDLYVTPPENIFDAPMDVNRSHFSVISTDTNGGTCRDIKVNPHGKISKEFAKYIALHGMDLDK